MEDRKSFSKNVVYTFFDNGVKKFLYDLPCSQQMTITVAEDKLLFSGNLDVYDRRYVIVKSGGTYTLVDRRNRTATKFDSARDAVVSACVICKQIGLKMTCGKSDPDEHGDAAAPADGSGRRT